MNCTFFRTDMYQWNRLIWLAAEEEEEDSVAYILKEVQTENEDVIYAMVEDGVELNAISKVFRRDSGRCRY